MLVYLERAAAVVAAASVDFDPRLEPLSGGISTIVCTGLPRQPAMDERIRAVSVLPLPFGDVSA
jgi:hypothetical protein